MSYLPSLTYKISWVIAAAHIVHARVRAGKIVQQEGKLEVGLTYVSTSGKLPLNQAPLGPVNKNTTWGQISLLSLNAVLR